MLGSIFKISWNTAIANSKLDSYEREKREIGDKYFYLIEKAKQKDEKAFNTLLNTYWSDVFRFQLSKASNEDEAEDITIKTFSKAFDKIHLYNSRYNFKTWLISISKNIFLFDYYNRYENMTLEIFSGDIL